MGLEDGGGAEIWWWVGGVWGFRCSGTTWVCAGVIGVEGFAAVSSCRCLLLRQPIC